MTRRRVRMVGLVCALVGALCLLAGALELFSNKSGALSEIGMGSTLAGVGWVCLASIRRPKRRKPARPQMTWGTASEKALPIILGGTLGVLTGHVLTRTPIPLWASVAYPCLSAAIAIPLIRYRDAIRLRRKESS